MEKLEITRRADGRLVMKSPNDKGEIIDTPVQAVGCFPWGRFGEYISIRDDKGRELRLLEKLDDVDAASRSLIEEELALRNFVPRITAIESVTDELELFNWKVRTAAGPRTFLTNRNEHPRTMPGGALLIKDVCNDLYVIPKPEELDAASYRLLWVYLD